MSLFAGKSKSIATLFSELKGLSVQYVKDELGAGFTGIFRWIAYGLGGAVAFSFAAFFAVLGTLRGLQEHTSDNLTGHLTWVPYLAGFGLTLVLFGLTIVSMKNAARRRTGRS